MNYGDVKQAFLTRLNRRDVTPSQVDVWLKQIIQQVQLLLRTPAQERTVEFSIGNIFNGLAIPGDYLKLKSILVNGFELDSVDLGTVLRASSTAGQPEFYCRDGGVLRIGPKPGPGSIIHLTYFANFPDLVADTDSNWLTEVGWPMLLNGAMMLAAMHFENAELIPLYEAQFARSMQDNNNMADEDEMSNSVMSPAYSMHF